jgi:hypothetical protein
MAIVRQHKEGDMGNVPYTPEAVTDEWLSEAIGKDVTDFSLEQIGVGVGILGRLYRVTMNGGKDSAVAKFPTLDEGARMNVVAPLRFYEKEVRFYEEAAKDTPVATPEVYASSFDPDSGDFVLLLEDLGSRRMEDQIAGCPVEDAYTAVDALVDVHATWWNSKSFPSWMPSYSDVPYPQVIAGMYKQAWPRAVEIFEGHLSSTYMDFGDRYEALVPWFMDTLTTEPRTMCHGDFRLDNLFFAHGDGHAPVTVVDWQICFKGRGAYDLAYFISQSLETNCRRDHEQKLKDRYLEGLASKGVDYPADQFASEYATTVAYCFIYAAVSAGQIEMTNERMRELILGMLDRAVQAIDDNNSLAVLPS